LEEKEEGTERNSKVTHSFVPDIEGIRGGVLNKKLGLAKEAGRRGARGRGKGESVVRQRRKAHWVSGKKSRKFRPKRIQTFSSGERRQDL